MYNQLREQKGSDWLCDCWWYSWYMCGLCSCSLISQSYLNNKSLFTERPWFHFNMFLFTDRAIIIFSFSILNKGTKTRDPSGFPEGKICVNMTILARNRVTCWQVGKIMKIVTKVNRKDLDLEYLDVWLHRPLVQYRVGQTINGELNGVQQTCEVLVIDSSLIQVVFQVGTCKYCSLKYFFL